MIGLNSSLSDKNFFAAADANMLVVEVRRVLQWLSTENEKRQFADELTRECRRYIGNANDDKEGVLK